MQEKSTSSLENELSACSNLDSFLKENENTFEDCTMAEVLNHWMEIKGMKRTEVIAGSGLSTVYAHQLLSGYRSPSRNKLLCLAFGLKLNLEEAQQLLKKCGIARLYVKNRRDSVIMYGLENEQSIGQVNEKLYDEGEDVLC